MFSNLIDNAAKFTPAGGQIQIRVTAAGREAEISVGDNGEGIPPEMLGRVFDMFKQVGRPEGHLSKGLGIGLTLVRSLVRKHGGSIEVRSEGAGKGSEFIVRLPRVAEVVTPAAVDGAPKPAAGPETRKVLVVDDAASIADVLALFFKLEGFTVQAEYGGEAAVAACGAFMPDLVFMDVGMPGMDGLEAARRMRKSPGGDRMVLVALTGWGQEADRLKCQEAGFDHHLTKPVSPQVLREFLAVRP